MRWWPLFLLVAACSEDELAEQPPDLLPALAPEPPGAMGPYAVGVTTLETTDGEEGGRALPVEVWYPADGDGELAHYVLTIGELVVADLPSPRGALRDAPLDLRGAPFPTVVFSHGFGGTRIQSVYLTEYLASHGFVVAAPDHVGNTFAEQVNSAGATTALESARVRPIDVGRTLDLLLAVSDGWPDEPLAFAADPARVGVAGHSFGGFTALRIAGASIDVSAGDAACAADPGLFFCDGWPPAKPFPESARDPRFIAALPQAPGGSAVFDDAGIADVAVPTMIQAGTSDATTPFAEEAQGPFDALETSAWLLAIDDAGHFTFSDMCELIEQVGLSVEAFEDGCSPANIPYAEAHAIIVRWATSFLKLHVAGEDDAFYQDDLAPTATLPSAATLTKKD